jgi:hypothetical protein
MMLTGGAVGQSTEWSHRKAVPDETTSDSGNEEVLKWES